MNVNLADYDLDGDEFKGRIKAVSERKELGKIQKVWFGLGGYQEVQVGLWLQLGSEGWGIGTGEQGGWSFPPDTHAKWTLEDQTQSYALMVRKVLDLLTAAKVDDVSKLKGVPVECIFEGNALKSYRILSEVL